VPLDFIFITQYLHMKNTIQVLVPFGLFRRFVHSCEPISRKSQEELLDAAQIDGWVCCCGSLCIPRSLATVRSCLAQLVLERLVCPSILWMTGKTAAITATTFHSISFITFRLIRFPEYVQFYIGPRGVRRRGSIALLIYSYRRYFIRGITRLAPQIIRCFNH